MEVLHDGLHFPKDYKNFVPVSKINGEEVQWTLGSVIYKTKYYAAK